MPNTIDLARLCGPQESYYSVRHLVTEPRFLMRDGLLFRVAAVDVDSEAPAGSAWVWLVAQDETADHSDESLDRWITLKTMRRFPDSYGPIGDALYAALLDTNV